jgi:hypothetical protein
MIDRWSIEMMLSGSGGRPMSMVRMGLPERLLPSPA